MNLARVETLGVGVIRAAPAFRSCRQTDVGRDYAVRDGVLVALRSPVLAIHGGAGRTRRPHAGRRLRHARHWRPRCVRAMRVAGGQAGTHAVAAAIVVLEDAPMFNAARCSPGGRNELDTSIWTAPAAQAGAAAALHRVKNPSCWRAIMGARPVMMVGEGAEIFAGGGIALVIVRFHRSDGGSCSARWKPRKAPQTQADAGGRPTSYRGRGRAGQRHLAAGTSTGGMTNKRCGRVIDSPIIGAGTGPTTTARSRPAGAGASAPPRTRSARACDWPATASPAPPTA